jgi:hypothetical protein
MIRLLKSAIPFSPGSPPQGATEVEEAAVSTEAGIEEPTGDARDQTLGGDERDADRSLEEGIASIFAMIRSSNEADELPEGLTIEETGPTYELLSELDRVWNNAQSA